MLEKYESKQQQIHRDAGTIYSVLSDFNNFTPLVADKVEGWTVEGDTCSFKVKGIAMTLSMTETRCHAACVLYMDSLSTSVLAESGLFACAVSLSRSTANRFSSAQQHTGSGHFFRP